MQVYEDLYKLYRSVMTFINYAKLAVLLRKFLSTILLKKSKKRQSITILGKNDTRQVTWVFYEYESITLCHFSD